MKTVHVCEGRRREAREAREAEKVQAELILFICAETQFIKLAPSCCDVTD